MGDELRPKVRCRGCYKPLAASQVGGGGTADDRARTADGGAVRLLGAKARSGTHYLGISAGGAFGSPKNRLKPDIG